MGWDNSDIVDVDSEKILSNTGLSENREPLDHLDWKCHEPLGKGGYATFEKTTRSFLGELWKNPGP